MMPKRIVPLCTLLALLLAFPLNASHSVAAPMQAIEDFNMLLGRPTDDSITVNVVPDQSGEISFEYGTGSGVYGNQTSATPCTVNEPVEVVIDGLTSNTRYYYRLRFRAASGDPWTAGGEHSFHTQRPPGSTFIFTITSDAHPNVSMFFNPDQYAQTLTNVLGDNPDFHLDLGDAFAMDWVSTVAAARQAYRNQRSNMAVFSHSVPVLLVIGNHENEEGWNLDDTGNIATSQPIIGVNARKMYYPNPIPDDFYSGNDDTLPEIEGDHLREDYYAWEWGDALFVVIEPYWYSLTWPSEGDTYGGEGDNGTEPQGDRWDWTLGEDQYQWLKQTLEESDATFKFVFTHHVTGGVIPYGRGGVAAAPYFEWGGLNWDGTPGFATERPGWEAPIHQLMVDNGVDIFFHAHDHCFAKEELDGIVYQESPMPANTGPNNNGNYNFTGFCEDNPSWYPDADVLPNSGHLRVTVSPDEATVDYVRAYLPGGGTNGEISYSYTIPAETPTTILGGVNDDDVVNSTDALIILSSDVGLDTSQYCPMNCGDVNGDGYVNSTDALIILSYDVGMTVPYPIGQPGCPSSVMPAPGCTP